MDRAQLKTDGIAFGRNLQAAYKSVVMYSMEHPAVGRAVQQAYDSLFPLLQSQPQLIFGFMNRRLLLNDFLTDEPSLRLLDTELTRRGIAAVTFSGGIKPEEFRQALNILTAKPKAIEEAGGTKAYLAAHPLTGARVLPAKKPEEAGDTVLGMDTESYLMAGEDLPLQEAKSGRAVDVLLHLAQMERAFDAPRADSDLLEVAGKAAEQAFLDPAADPRAIATALGRALEEVTPERFLSSLPVGRQAELRGRPTQDLAAEVMEDMTVRWVTKRLAAARQDALTAGGEEEALRVMMVGLNMTRMVDRLLQKLARTLEEAELPPALFERIRQGIVWNSLAARERHDRLMQTTQFDAQQFRFLLDYVKECLQAKKIEDAIAVATHYFRFLDGPGAALEAELPRSVELLRTLAGPATLPFMSGTVQRLSEKLPDASGECHGLLTAALLEVVQLMLPHEGFDTAHLAGMALARSLARDPRQHADCCGAALQHLLPSASAGRLINLYMEMRGDAGLARAAVDLLTWLGPAGGEEAFARLVDETLAPNRVRLLRLLAQLGAAGMEAARRRLSDERWYVVRNACHVLGELGDPGLPKDLQDPLQHPDARVQQAAVAALVKCQAPGATAVLSGALPSLEAGVAEKALEELLFRKDPDTIDGLEQFLLAARGTKPGALAKAVQSLALIPTERAAAVLGSVLPDPGHAPMVRRAAADALLRSPHPNARRLLEQFVQRFHADPLTAVIRRGLDPR